MKHHLVCNCFPHVPVPVHLEGTYVDFFAGARKIFFSHEMIFRNFLKLTGERNRAADQLLFLPDPT